MPKVLTGSQVDELLKGLDGWSRKGDFIVKKFEFESFMDGIGFVNKVAAVAEEQDHHPDIRVRYTEVKLSIQTHSEGGVTKWDIGLAKAIDKIS